MCKYIVMGTHANAMVLPGLIVVLEPTAESSAGTNHDVLGLYTFQVPLKMIQTFIQTWRMLYIAAHNIHNLSSSLQDNSAGWQMLWNGNIFVLLSILR